MNEFLTYEEAMFLLNPNSVSSYCYTQQKINKLIQVGHLVKPLIYAKSKSGQFIEICSNSVRLVTSESVIAKVKGCSFGRGITVIYNDGTKKIFKSSRSACKYYGIYFAKIINSITLKKSVVVPLIGDRIKIVQEYCLDTNIKTEHIYFQDTNK